jgi:hypothetical protein
LPGQVIAAIDRWWYVPGPAARLGALRVISGGFALGYLLLRWPNLISYADFEASQFEPVGVANVLGQPIDAWLVQAAVLTAIAMGVAFVFGWRFAVTGPLFAVMLLWTLTYRNSFGQIFHTENLLVLHVIILAASPAADALSLDARRRGYVPDDDGRYGWGVRLMCAVTVLTYFISGLTKIRNAGLDWVTTDSLRNYIAYDNLRKAELGDTHSPVGAWLVAHGWLFHPLAAFTLFVELCAPFALVNARMGRVWAACAMAFHWGILLMMAIVFPYPLTGAAFASFFPVERLRLPSLRRATRRSEVSAQSAR